MKTKEAGAVAAAHRLQRWRRTPSAQDPAQLDSTLFRASQAYARRSTEADARIDLDPLREVARHRIGDILMNYGAKIRGSSERGRATNPVTKGDGFSVAYGNGLATFHAEGGVTRDPLAIVAAVLGLDLRRREDFLAAVKELSAILESPTTYDTRARKPGAARSAPPPGLAPARDPGVLWDHLARSDMAGESYLAGRGLQIDPLPSDLVRFNVGSRDAWLRGREAEGYRLTFPVRGPDGTVLSLSLRRVGPPPTGEPKTLTLPRCPISGAAICRPEIVLLASGDAEFGRDEVVVVEGGPDALAATIAFDRDALEGLVPPTWALGAIGTAAVPGMLKAFANTLRGRTVHIALDIDVRGEEAVPAAVEAARAAGAKRITRMRPPSGKDIADGLRETCHG